MTEALTERDKFEAWCAREYGPNAYLHRSSTCGEWDSWQARASLPAPAVPPLSDAQINALWNKEAKGQEDLPVLVRAFARVILAVQPEQPEANPDHSGSDCVVRDLPVDEGKCGHCGMKVQLRWAHERNDTRCADLAHVAHVRVAPGSADTEGRPTHGMNPAALALPRWTASPDELLHALGQWRDGTISDDEFYGSASADLAAMLAAAPSPAIPPTVAPRG